MTRILSWNIENFELEKIISANTTIQQGTGKPHNEASSARRDVLRRLLTTLTTPSAGAVAEPDIVILIEILTKKNGYDHGHLLSGDGLNGVFVLLNDFRQAFPQSSWMMVPPVETGERISCVVFYKSASLVFTGPWRWPGGSGPAFNPAPPGAPQVGAYPAAFNGYLPTTTVPMNRNLPNEGAAIDRLAGRVTFGDLQGQAVAFSGLRPRAPLNVTFADAHPPLQGTARTYSIFAVHAPAGVSDPIREAYLSQAASIASIAGAVDPDHVIVVAGDFNSELVNNGKYANAYKAFETLGFSLGLKPTIPVTDAVKGYFSTMLKPLDQALCKYVKKPLSSNYYPGYGYTGSASLSNASVDNILVRYGTATGSGQPCGALTNVTVVNAVIGSPYDRVTARAAAPIGAFHCAAAVFDHRAVTFQNPLTAGQEIMAFAAFRQWENYGQIRSTSDHMPIVADV